MANVISTLLKLDATSFKTGLKSAQQSIRETDGVVNKAKVGWSSAFASFASSPAVVAGATAAVGTFAAASVKASSDLTESINAVNVTFGESADKILEFGENAAKSVGLAKSEFNELATPLGSILKNAGFDLDTVADKTIVLTQRAADMASVFNTDVSEALGAIQAGLRGEQDPLERFGVGLSAAKVEQRALADTGKKTTKELTDQEKQLARINIILDQTNQTAGDFANTSDGLANQTRILRAEFENFKADAGTLLIPALSDIAKELQFVADVAKLAEDAIGAIPSARGFKFNPFQGGIGIAIDAAKNVGEAWKGAGADVEDASDRFNDSILRTTTGAKEAAAALDPVAQAAKDAADKLVDLGDKAANSGPKIGDMAGALDNAREHLADLNEEARDNAMDTLANAIKGVKDALDATFGSLEDDLSSLDLLDDIKDQFDAVAEAAKEANDPKGVRDLNREVRRLQGQLLDYLRTVDDIPPDKVTEIIAQIRTGDIETLKATLDELTKDRFINITPVVLHDAFHSVNASFTPGSAPSAPTFQGVTAAPNQPVSTDARTIINYYPVGTTPTTQYQNDQIDARRNGPR